MYDDEYDHDLHLEKVYLISRHPAHDSFDIWIMDGLVTGVILQDELVRRKIWSLFCANSHLIVAGQARLGKDVQLVLCKPSS